MKTVECTGLLNGVPSGGQDVKFADTEIDWYDFGGNNLIAPAIPPYEGNMASLCCIRNGKFYYTVVAGTFAQDDLPDLRKEWEPKFAADVQCMTQETKSDRTV